MTFEVANGAASFLHPDEPITEATLREPVDWWHLQRRADLLRRWDLPIPLQPVGVHALIQSTKDWEVFSNLQNDRGTNNQGKRVIHQAGPHHWGTGVSPNQLGKITLGSAKGLQIDGYAIMSDVEEAADILLEARRRDSLSAAVNFTRRFDDYTTTGKAKTLTVQLVHPTNSTQRPQLSFIGQYKSGYLTSGSGASLSFSSQLRVYSLDANGNRVPEYVEAEWPVAGQKTRTARVAAYPMLTEWQFAQNALSDGPVKVSGIKPNKPGKLLVRPNTTYQFEANTLCIVTLAGGPKKHVNQARFIYRIQPRLDVVEA